MEIEKQVCSIEPAKVLKKLKVKQNSIWYWIKFKEGWVLKSIKQVNKNLKAHRKMGDNMFAINALLEFWKDDCVSAFTVAELGEILKSKSNHSYYANLKNEWECKEDITDGKEYIEFDKTEANARAKMLIYLIKNNKQNEMQDPYRDL